MPLTFPYREINKLPYVDYKCLTSVTLCLSLSQFCCPLMFRVPPYVQTASTGLVGAAGNHLTVLISCQLGHGNHWQVQQCVFMQLWIHVKSGISSNPLISSVVWLEAQSLLKIVAVSYFRNDCKMSNCRYICNADGAYKYALCVANLASGLTSPRPCVWS